MQESLCYKDKDYSDKFDTFVYLQRYADVRQVRSSHMLSCYHNTFKNLPNDLHVLDYGSGPTIVATISAAAKASEIVLSDFSPTNCQVVRNWLDKKQDAFDWGNHFQFVVRELEGKGEEEVLRRQQKVREVVKSVVHCDLTQDPPIEESCNKLYDVVVSSFVIESIAKSYEEYKSLLFRLTRLVKPNGCLMIYGVENNQYYTIGDFKFQDFPVSSKMAMDAIKECGFFDIQIEKTPVFKLGYKEVIIMFIKATREMYVI